MDTLWVRLLHAQEPVQRGPGNHLAGAARPEDLDLARRVLASEAEEHPSVARREIAPGGRHQTVGDLPACAGELDACADGVAVAARAAQLQGAEGRSPARARGS